MIQQSQQRRSVRVRGALDRFGPPLASLGIIIDGVPDDAEESRQEPMDLKSRV